MNNKIKGKKLFDSDLHLVCLEEYSNPLSYSNFIENLSKLQSTMTSKIFSTDVKIFTIGTSQKRKKYMKSISNYRASLSNNVKTKWDLGSDLKIMIKVILCQLFTDDTVSADERFNTMKLRQIYLEAKSFMEIYEKANLDDRPKSSIYDEKNLNSVKPQKLKPLKKIESIDNPKIQQRTNVKTNIFFKKFDKSDENIENEIFMNSVTPIKVDPKDKIPTKFTGEIKIVDKKIKFELEISEIMQYSKEGFEKIKDKFDPCNFPKESHNQIFNELNSMIQSFLNLRSLKFENELKSKINEIEGINKDYEIVRIQNYIQVPNTVQMCLKNCKECQLVCIESKNNSHVCNCSTNHICGLPCKPCKGKRLCSLLMGHIGSHKCNKKEHFCKKQCSHCLERCCLKRKHNSVHKCSTFHSCTSKCNVPNCMNTCKEEIDCVHPSHRCFLKKCMYKCELNIAHECSSLNHFHQLDLKSGEKHLCNLRHVCPNKCIGRGLCSIKTIKSIRKYGFGKNEFEYFYAELEEERKFCTTLIEAGKSSHDENIHHCDKGFHFCGEKCPDCGSFCDKEYGHSGFHQSSTHRNKENVEYKSSKKIFEEEVLDRNNNKVTAMFLSGDSPTPLNCEQFCLLKGIGHFHSVKCKGNLKCYEISNREKCVHYESGGSFDLLECTFYWNSFEWIPPVQMVDEEKQKEFGKCNFRCGHQSHDQNLEVFYCTDNLFHTKSSDYDKHFFACTHIDIIFYDIVFIIDSTGSMGEYFEKVKNIVNGLINKWGKAQTRFAVVAFTDHDQSANYPEDDPTDVYPKSLDLNDGNPEDAASFIGKLQASGGGPVGGEALIDALAKSNKLNFRENSNKMLFVLTDEKPHGKEFGPNEIHPDGCPCQISWRDELKKIRDKNAQFLFVKLNETLAQTINLFRGELGDLLIEYKFEGLENFDLKVTDIIAYSMDQQIIFNKGKI